MKSSYRIRLILSVLLPCVLFSSVSARGSALPWLASLGAERLADIHTLSTEASVSVSDGLTYTTASVFHDRQRAVFRLTYPDRVLTQGVEGRYLWTFDGEQEKEAPPFVEDFVLGHQMHAQLLFFDRLHPAAVASEKARFADRECSVLASEDGWRLYYEPAGRPLGMEKERAEEAAIIFTFDDWRDVAGMTLPFAVQIDDGEREFQYRYTSVELNEGSLADFRAPDEALTEEQKLLRLHRIAMDGHLFGRTAEMTSAHGDSVVFVSRGEIHTLERQQSAAIMEGIMASRDYTIYDDLTRPIVRISEDGTLGWVIAQVSAKGARLDADGAPADPLEFVSAWIELYEKVAGRWRLTGNVSNFFPT